MLDYAHNNFQQCLKVKAVKIWGQKYSLFFNGQLTAVKDYSAKFIVVKTLQNMLVVVTDESASSFSFHRFSQIKDFENMHCYQANEN